MKTKILLTLFFLSVNSEYLFAQQSPHGPIKIPCINCHTTEGWKELARPMRFDHTTTGFSLQGAHANAQCIQCHSTKRFTGTSTDCFICHTADFAIALSPNHQLGKFSHECLSCHTMTGWKPSVFQHSKTNFQLVGAHLSVDCASCHANNHFAGLSHDCYSCHQKDFVQTTSPNHKTGQLSHDCLTCHSSIAWKPSTFDHKKTNFQLVGAHTNAECSSCHINGKFKGLPTDCYTCHTKDFVNAKTLNHLPLSHDCLSCHTTIVWNPSAFDHNKTKLQLTGAHATAECNSCHLSNKFPGLPTDCYTCHTQDFVNVKTIAHSKLSHDCLTCHTNIVWKPSTFDHNKTKLQLTGAHATVECNSCHLTNKFAGLPTDCYTCHMQDFVKIITPNHLLAQFSHDCLTCHTNLVWKPSTFNHSATTFPLVGSHAAVVCGDCHKNGVFKGLPSDCFSCHQTVFNSTTNPNHTTGQFSHDCLTCHTNLVWKPSTFNHSATTFPLVGAHVSVACASCHINVVFKGLPSDCFSCHQTVFNSTVNPNHATGQFSHDCLTCHTNLVWKPSTFNHNTTVFPLAGAHVSVACVDCHKSGPYKATSTVCYDCHMTVFNATTTPSHVTSQFSHDCLTCHSNLAWKPATFNHSTTAFPLVGAHISVACASCHINGVFKGLPSDCFSCHQTVFNSTINPNHATGQFSHDCLTCHTNLVWKPSTFNHNTTVFPLAGAHVSVACVDCHKSGPYKATSTVCYDCHMTVFNATTTPSHVTSQFSHDCLTCHSNLAWKPATFNHSTTAFPLVGAHISVACASCHINGVFKGLPSDCFSCHQTVFNSTVNPNHATGQFSHDCLTCHTNLVWKPSTFNHNTTVFPLAGAHVSVACVDCHKSGPYKATSTVCYDCHMTVFNATTTPSHVTSQFSHDCLTCHSNLAWKPATFNHSTTAFPLVGAHISVACASCHINGVFKGLPSDCFSCHQTVFNSTVNPNHATGQFSHDCLTCHTNLVWKPSTFNHNTTVFPLAGAHVSVACVDCHKSGPYKATSTVCYDCHMTVFNATTTPSHVTSQFSHDCLTCHSNLAWKPATFNHSTTAFPLVGAHISVACASCHINGVFKGLPSDCFSCHQTVFNSTVNPNHATGQFSHDCLTCHTNLVWKPSTFNHNTTVFPLAGAHVSVACVDCHKSGPYKATSTVCYDCHMTVFNATTTPSHVTSQFSHDCLTCHSNLAWKPATFNHSTTAFPLVGAHISVACASCHINGVFKGLPSDCFSCHQTVFNSTVNPNHATGQFSHDCLTCHTNLVWKPSTFNHANTNFPLLGAHAAVVCGDCHKNGVYKGTTMVCYDCHITVFNATTTPSHVTSQFSHDCLTCHTMTAWKPSTFNHSTTAFPLVGAHVSAPCVNCHKNGVYKGTTTDCYTCHLTDYNGTTNPNHVSGVYTSMACTSCHNTTLWIPWIFGHDTFYKVSKHHGTSVKCASCHTAPGNFVFASCTTGCHSGAHNKNQTCYTANCHGGSKN